MQDNHEKVLVLDFGGQYNQLIARRVREHNVYAEIKPYSRITVDEIKAAGYVGIIFTGGPNSVYDESSPHYSPEILDAGIPVLGICYGAQLIAYMAGGVVKGQRTAQIYPRGYEGLRDEPHGLYQQPARGLQSDCRHARLPLRGDGER